MEDEQELDFQSYGILPFTARRALEGIGNGLEESFTPELTSIWATNQTQKRLTLLVFSTTF